MVSIGKVIPSSRIPRRSSLSLKTMGDSAGERLKIRSRRNCVVCLNRVVRVVLRRVRGVRSGDFRSGK